MIIGKYLPVVERFMTRVITRNEVRNGTSWLAKMRLFLCRWAVMYIIAAEHTAFPTHRMTGNTMTSDLYEY